MLFIELSPMVFVLQAALSLARFLNVLLAIQAEMIFTIFLGAQIFVLFLIFLWLLGVFITNIFLFLMLLNSLAWLRLITSF